MFLSQKITEDSLTSILQVTNKIIETKDSLTDYLKFERVITARDNNPIVPPDHLPPTIDLVMREGNLCLASKCWNAAGAMFRLALDLATKDALPTGDEPAAKIRRNLGLRLPWLFDNGLLPLDLKHLAQCVQQDGNDGAHDGSLTELDAHDLSDFSFELLRRIYTEPKRIELAAERRTARRNEK